MPTVLHISAAGAVWWEKTAKGWNTVDGPANHPVWVMTDLSEETFVEISVPRVFGTDREAYIQRQLASRFPETVFCRALPPRRKGSIMERLAPPMQTLTAIEPGDRIRAALKPLNVPIAGVWSASAILTQLGRRSSFPRNMFIVLCQSTNLRILFLKERAPVLTRLVRSAQTATDQGAEIVRTLRHLENTHVIERNAQRFGILLLGTVEDLPPILTRDRLDIVPTTVLEGRKFDGDWQSRLFDLVCQSPMGQLAPISYRASYLARNMAKAAYLASALILLGVLWMASASINDILRTQREQTQAQQTLNQLTAQTSELDEAIQAFGVSPDAVRNALALDTDEIVSAPDMQAHLVRLSQAVGAVAGARLKSLQWQLLASGEAACAHTDALVPAAVPVPDPADNQPPSRLVELQMALQLPEDSGPRKTALQASEMTRQLAQMEGAAVLIDPTKSLLTGDIHIGSTQSQTDGGRDLTWCLTLPGKTPQNPENKAGKP
ncbi:MAG: hypothetical protein IPH35_06130 [Rhodoferax sp.]|nr:hypothetical protein [Rhodoferax sp.]